MTNVAEPPWLVAMVDQRLAKIREGVGSLDVFPANDVVMTPLTEPKEGANQEEYDIWDQTCDSCGAHVPNKLFTGTVVRVIKGTKFMFMFGVCTSCRERDTGEHLEHLQ